jgi:hypothetical protein
METRHPLSPPPAHHSLDSHGLPLAENVLCASYLDELLEAARCCGQSTSAEWSDSVEVPFHTIGGHTLGPATLISQGKQDLKPLRLEVGEVVGGFHTRSYLFISRSVPVLCSIYINTKSLGSSKREAGEAGEGGAASDGWTGIRLKELERPSVGAVN